MNELDMIKLNIYEAYDNNEITYGEKCLLLEKVDYMYEEYKKMTLKDLNPDDFPDDYPDDETVVNKHHNNINNSNNTSTTSKGLSKGAKIGIGAGAVAAGLTTKSTDFQWIGSNTGINYNGAAITNQNSNPISWEPYGNNQTKITLNGVEVIINNS